METKTLWSTWTTGKYTYRNTPRSTFPMITTTNRSNNDSGMCFSQRQAKRICRFQMMKEPMWMSSFWWEPSRFDNSIIWTLLQDKKLRACFILYFAELLYGYHYYILYTRIKGNFEKKRTTSLTFHVGAFRGFRRLTDPMSSSLFKSVYFQTFILTRALPRRKHDLFDEVSCLKDLDQLVYKQKVSNLESKKIIEQISCELIQKERFMEKCSVRKQETFTKIHWTLDRKLEENCNSIIHTVKPKMRSNALLQAMLPVVNTHVEYHANLFDAYAHRIEALRNCLGAIFENKSSFASKSLDAVKSSMRYAPLRIELCRLLNQKTTLQALLTDKQFEDISLLMNAALQGECEEDKDGVVRSLMYLSNVFSRVSQH